MCEYLEEVVFDEVMHSFAFVVHPERVKIDVDDEEPYD